MRIFADCAAGVQVTIVRGPEAEIAPEVELAAFAAASELRKYERNEAIDEEKRRQALQ